MSSFSSLNCTGALAQACPCGEFSIASTGQGEHESTGLESVKERNRNQGGFQMRMTVPGQRENRRPGLKMQGLDALKAAVPGFVRRKGRSGCRISALELAYEGYRLTIS